VEIVQLNHVRPIWSMGGGGREGSLFDGYICKSGSIDYCATMKKNVSEYSEAHKTVEYGDDCSIQVLIFNTV